VTEIIINAPKPFLWDKLVDFESYKDWNPFILEARAEFKVGSKTSLAWKTLYFPQQKY
jgi:hypothetical protein